jgi:hypothetical protein
MTQLLSQNSAVLFNAAGAVDRSEYSVVVEKVTIAISSNVLMAAGC